MIKHIVGFVLFSFIVGTSAFVYGLIFGVPDVSVSEPARFERDWYAEKKKRKKKCRRHRRPHPHFYQKSHGLDHPGGTLADARVRVLGAEYDSVADTLKVSVSASPDVDPLAVADLHFYVSDEFGVRYLKTETVGLKPDGTMTEEHSFRWLKNFQQKERLFVIAEAKDLSDGFVDPKGFSEELAARVTVR